MSDIDYREIDKAMLREMSSWEGSKRPGRFWDEGSGGGRAARMDLAKAVLEAAGVLPKSEEPSQQQTMVERVGEELRKECIAVFGSMWSNDVAWRFAKVAIEAMREPSAEILRAAVENSSTIGDEGVFRVAIDEQCAREAWTSAIDAALKEHEEKTNALPR